MTSYDGTIEIKRNSRTPIVVNFERDSDVSLNLNTLADDVRLQVANAAQTGYLIQDKETTISGSDQVQVVFTKADCLAILFDASSGSANTAQREFGLDVEVLWSGQTDYQKLAKKYRIVLLSDWPINTDAPE